MTEQQIEEIVKMTITQCIAAAEKHEKRCGKIEPIDMAHFVAGYMGERVRAALVGFYQASSVVEGLSCSR
jgi:hypothetical protein